MKKSWIILISIIVVLLLLICLFFVYMKPTIQIVRMEPTTTDQNQYLESITCIESAKTFLGMDSFQIYKKQLTQEQEISNWSNSVVTELQKEYLSRPHHIEVFSEVKNKETTLRYEGWVTTKEGEKIEYKQEKVFDFVLDSNPL